jgi:Long-chain fatty aldehyde decarbonylase
VPPPTDEFPWARTSVDVAFKHDYASDAPRLRLLYEKGKRSQWNPTTDIDWNVAVEFGAPLPYAPGAEDFLNLSGSAQMWDRFRWESQAWMVSQFLHGEQGALLATARLVETMPFTDARLYAASQVADEARHVEVYARYLTEKLRHAYPVDPSLAELLRNIMSDSRWDIVCLGMQVIVEGLALAAFRLGEVTCSDPLIRQITARVARDEARHVAFGDLALQGYFDQLTTAELRDREEFVMEAVLLMGRRFRLGEVWDRLEIDRSAGTAFAATNERMIASRQVLFGRIVMSLSKLGLLTPGVRRHLNDMALLPKR